MKTHQFLKFQRYTGKRTPRNWVKDLVPQTSASFSLMAFDIKYIYVAGKRINALVLTVLDVYSRWNMGQYVAWNIKALDVIKLF